MKFLIYVCLYLGGRMGKTFCCLGTKSGDLCRSNGYVDDWQETEKEVNNELTISDYRKTHFNFEPLSFIFLISMTKKFRRHFFLDGVCAKFNG